MVAESWLRIRGGLPAARRDAGFVESVRFAAQLDEMAMVPSLDGRDLFCLREA